MLGPRRHLTSAYLPIRHVTAPPPCQEPISCARANWDCAFARASEASSRSAASSSKRRNAPALPRCLCSHIATCRYCSARSDNRATSDFMLCCPPVSAAAAPAPAAAGRSWCGAGRLPTARNHNRTLPLLLRRPAAELTPARDAYHLPHDQRQRPPLAARCTLVDPVTHCAMLYPLRMRMMNSIISHPCSG